MNVPVIAPQTVPNLLNREAAHEQVAQLVQLPIRPFPPGVHGRRLIVRLGPERIEDRGPYQAQQRFALGISRVVPVQARPCAVVLPRQLPIITS
jgi:hypothetical protein